MNCNIRRMIQAQGHIDSSIHLYQAFLFPVEYSRQLAVQFGCSNTISFASEVQGTVRTLASPDFKQ